MGNPEVGTGPNVTGTRLHVQGHFVVVEGCEAATQVCDRQRRQKGGTLGAESVPLSNSALEAHWPVASSHVPEQLRKGLGCIFFFFF